MEKIVEKQKQNRWRMATTSARERIDRLIKLRDKVLASREKIYQALALDFCKNNMEVELTEIQPVIAESNFHIKHLRRWMRPMRVKTNMLLMGTKSYIKYEPRGVVLIVSPWNYPFHLAIVPIISALAAGNCVVLKPSEFTPHTSELLQTLISETFPEDEVSVVTGEADVAKKLIEQGFDHIFFTGSSQTGKLVMEAAGRHLSSVTLELGGKSPVIVDSAVNISKVVPKIIWGKFINAGQTCVAPDYVLLSEQYKDIFLQQARQILNKFYGEKHKECKDFCRVVNKKHFQRLQKLFNEAIEQGAKIEIGGDFDEQENYISPTILSNVAKDSAIMQEEIFGPILPIVCVQTIEESISFIHSQEKPLALYIFSHNRRNTRKILQQTSAGGTCVNNVAIHLGNPHLPFGGVNNSGIGSYHGFFGFKTFSHERSIMYQGPISGTSFVYPPYKEKMSALIRWVTNKLA